MSIREQAPDEHLSRLVLQNATDFAIITTDLEGHVTQWNPGAETLWGLPAARVLGRALPECFAPEARAVFHELLHTTRTHGRARHERWQVREDGSRFWASGSMTRLQQTPSGEPLGYLLILQDQTSAHEERGGREAEARFRALIETFPQVVWFADAQARSTYCNPFWEQYTGLSAEETRGDGWGRVIHPDHLQQVFHQWKDCVEREQEYEQEILFRRASDGTYRWFLVRSLPLRDARGVIESWGGIAIDIHDRKLAEEALYASEERFRSVADATPGFIWTADRTGLLDYTSPRWHSYSGSSATDSNGTGWAAFVHPEDQPRAFTAWAASLSSGTLYETEFRLRAHDGAYRWWLARALPIHRQGEVARWAGVCTDMHELITARETLARSREQLEALLTQRTADHDRLWRLSIDGMMVADFQARIVAVNPAWTRLSGWSEQELVGMSFMGLVHPEDREKTLSEVSHLEGGRTTLRFENRYRHREGGYRTLSWNAVPDGELIYAIARDVTAERQAAAELEHAQEALRQAQKMEAVGQLTGGIAHDFNNLLTGILGALDMMRRRHQLGQKVDIERYTTAAMNSANRAAALTHRLLAFSRRQPLEPRPVNANRLAAGMEELLRRTLGEKIRLEIIAAGGLWQTLCDPHQLENAILNLAINARDAMPSGGQLTVETSNSHLDSAYAALHREVRPGQYICISVTDTGTGMTPEVVSKAFEPFFTTKPLGQGTGLGLSMIYGFIRQSEGHARIDSEPGQGTSVKLYLPRHHGAATDEGEAEVRRLRAAQEGQGEVVLVVEDEPAVRALVVDVLADLGYRAVEAVDGPSGLKLLMSGLRLDLLVTDVGLPGLNGRQLADAARQKRPELKILFMTGYAENATFAGGFLEHGMQLITKPFSIDALATRIRDIIEGP